MKDYYKILGVSRNATAEEIKKSYRKLAFLYHPDRNADPSAATLIKEINEAYDVLGDETTRNNYNIHYDNPAAYSNPSGPSRTSHRPASKKYYRKKNIPFNFQDWAFKARFFAAFVFIYCFFLTFDYFIAVNYSNIKINYIEAETYKTRRGGIINKKYSIETDQLNCTLTARSQIFLGDTLNLTITPLFGIATKCTRLNRSEIEPVEISNIYSPIYFLVIVVMILAVLAFTVKSQEKSLTYSIASCVLYVVVLLTANSI